MNPYVQFDPLGVNGFVEVAIFFLPAFLTLAAVAAIAGRSRWLGRHRPLRRFELRSYRASLWSLPILVWAFEVSLFTIKATRFEFFHSLMTFGLLTHVFLLQAFFTLCVLVVLQLAAVLVVEGQRLGLGTGGHFRVSMVYALIAVLLDSFLLLTVFIGNWPRGGS